jgi:hypothetical protein
MVAALVTTFHAFTRQVADRKVNEGAHARRQHALSGVNVRVAYFSLSPSTGFHMNPVRRRTQDVAC